MNHDFKPLPRRKGPPPFARPGQYYVRGHLRRRPDGRILPIAGHYRDIPGPKLYRVPGEVLSDALSVLTEAGDNE